MVKTSKDNKCSIAQKLADEHERCVAVFENSNDAFLLLKDKFIDCNKKACELFGCSAHDLINHTPYSFSPKNQPDGSNSKELAKEKIHQALTIGTQQFYWKHKRKDGTLFDAEVTLKSITIKGEPVLFSTVKDISSQLLHDEREERLLKEVEERNTNLINSLPSGLVIFSSNLEIRFTNPPFYKLLKYDVDADSTLTGILQFKLFNLPEVLPHIQQLISESTAFDIEVIANEHKGEKYYLRIRGYAFPSVSKGEQSYMMYISNITERKNVNEKLLKSEQRFRDIYNQSPIGIELYDNIGQLIDSNPAAFKIYGIEDNDELRNLNIYSNPDIPNWAKDQLLLGKTTRFRSMIDFEKIKKEDVFKTKMSGVSFIDVMAAPLVTDDKIHGFLFQFMNITEQMLAEEMLKKLIENSDYLVILQDITGKYLYFNGLYQYGTTGKDLIGKKPVDVLDKDVANEIMNRVARVIENDQVVNAENKLSWAGRELWFLDHSYPVHDMDGKIIAVGTISVDITERKKYELKIVESEKKLRDANATKERIFSIIRHDIMGPLGALKNLTEMIYNKPQILDAEESKEIMKAVKESSTSVFDLISTLTTWANSQNGDALYHPLTYSINEIVNECVQLLSASAINKNIKLWSDIKTEMNGYFDKIMITTVIRNLISNALKFTNFDGEVVIDAKMDNHYITVSVKDNGIGIKPENTRKLFDIDYKFTTSGTNNERGTGLGLNLCKNFITQNAGEIWVISEPGKGSIFSFTLPISKEFSNPPKQTSGLIDTSDLADRTILLVDDEHINLKVIEEYLLPTHVRLLYAHNGNEALEIFKNEPKIDLVLIDLLMPEMDGFEATKQIREIDANIPVIAQTSYDLDEHKKTFKQAGGTDYLVKPIIRKSLLHILNKYLI